MKLKERILLLIGIAAMISLVACAPQTTPSPVAPPAPVPTPAQPVPAPKALAPEEAAWNAIVEAAKKEGKLTIYSYNFVGDIGIAIRRAFEDKHGIALDIITGRGAEFLERVKTEKRMGRLVGDMMEGSSTHVRNMKNEGLTVSVAGEVPVVREKDVWVTDIFGLDPQDKHLIITNVITYTPYVNTNLVKPGEEPKAWRDLLEPKWKEKMVLSDPKVSTAPYRFFLPLLREKMIDEDFLKALYNQDLRFVPSQGEEGLILSRGERALSITGVDSVYARFIAEGAPIRALTLSDGTVITAIATAVFKGAPHPNAAKVFINWLLSTEGLTVWGKAASLLSVRKDVPNFLPKAAQITPPRPVLMTYEYDEEAAKFYRERWLDKLWGRR